MRDKLDAVVLNNDRYMHNYIQAHTYINNDRYKHFNFVVPKGRDHLRFRTCLRPDYAVVTKTRRKMATAISFSRQMTLAHSRVLFVARTKI